MPNLQNPVSDEQRQIWITKIDGLTLPERHDFVKSTLTPKQRSEWNRVRKELKAIDDYVDDIEYYIVYYFVGRSEFSKVILENPAGKLTLSCVSYAHLDWLRGESFKTIIDHLRLYKDGELFYSLLLHAAYLHNNTGKVLLGDALPLVVETLAKEDPALYVQDSFDLKHYFQRLNDWIYNTSTHKPYDAFPPNFFILLFPYAMKKIITKVEKTPISPDNHLDADFLYKLNRLLFPEKIKIDTRGPVHQRHMTQFKSYLLWYWRSQQWSEPVMEAIKAVATKQSQGTCDINPVFDVSYQPDQPPYEWPNEKVEDLYAEVYGKPKKKKSKEVYDEIYPTLHAEHEPAPFLYYCATPVPDGKAILETMSTYLKEH